MLFYLVRVKLKVCASKSYVFDLVRVRLEGGVVVDPGAQQ